MKGYKIFITIFLLLLVLYIIAEANRPKPVSWQVTLSKGDKNPYGAFVLFSRLKDIFPRTIVEPHRTPVYNQLNNFTGINTGYLLIGEKLELSKNDVDELLAYVANGNYAVIAAGYMPDDLFDSLGVKIDKGYSSVSTDSTTINFTDPSLRAAAQYTFKRMTIDEFFTRFDTSATTVLGINHRNKANFIEVKKGEGSFFIHANPIVFSNYFILHNDNATYTAHALSYLPVGLDKLYWDEYYKLGPLGVASPLRFFLANDYLRWALRLALAGMLLYVLFEMKRRQRIIPVIEPLRNSTMAFIQTIATVYLQQQDNKSIAIKKITYFFEYIRSKYYINTNLLDNEFTEHLSRKSGISMHETQEVVKLVQAVQSAEQVNDRLLLLLNRKIDQFYKQVQ